MKKTKKILLQVVSGQREQLAFQAWAIELFIQKEYDSLKLIQGNKLNIQLN